MQRTINNTAKSLKALILKFFRDYLENEVWVEFSNSLSSQGYYTHYSYDIPLLRDLKAFINIVESATRLTDQYPLRIVAVFELAQAYRAYQRSYATWASTEGVLTHYMEYGTDYTQKILIPIIYSKILKLYELCNRANLDKACFFFTKQMIRLENYKKNYLLEAHAPKKEPEEKVDLTDDLLKKLQDLSEDLLKKVYKDKFDLYFKKEKLKEDKDTQLRLFLELEHDKDETVRNLKKLSNGVIGIRQFLHDYDSFSQSYALSKLLWMPTLYSKLRSTFSLIQDFKYKDIIAEQSSPIVEYIKKFLKDLVNKIEQLACYIDEIEGMLHFKEGSLLKFVDEIINRYNQIANDLKIPIDFARQKRIYLKARLEHREERLEAIDTQLTEINKFLKYKNHPISFIPRPTLIKLQDFCLKYSDDIPMDRQKLTSYKKYLVAALTKTSSLESWIQLPLEYVGNYFTITIHSETMAALNKMHMYLRRERYYHSQRVDKIKKFNIAHPYDYFKTSDLAIMDSKKLVLNALKNRSIELSSEKESSFLKLTLQSEADSKEEKHQLDESLSQEFTAQVKEQEILRVAADKYDAGENISSLLEWMSNENVRPRSKILMQEIDQVLKRHHM